ncbi:MULTISPECIES: urease accessory protein UreE [unclassified Sphingobacterium]|uniref:urease accessory protein UreE n=1 Tax=unclassified Sphingobacterium TaxID=2609468 RepID=UPI0025EF14D7|nr:MULTISPECIES: urease accessory protein UreE [unclassified Sphingobacterium]
MLYISDNNYTAIPQGIAEEFVYMEWYEVRKTVLERETSAGRLVRLQREYGEQLHDGQVVHLNDNYAIRLYIKPCDCIILHAKDAQMAGQFSFDVGNRHLPVFCLNDQSFAVAYDGRLYSALSAKYAGYIELTSARLLPDQALHMFRKNKVTI